MPSDVPADDDSKQSAEPPGHQSRIQQLTSLMRDATYTVVEPDDPCAPGELLELYVKEHPRGPGYVCDFTFTDPRLPVTVYGVLLRGPTGLSIGELELFRARWGYFDDYGDYVGPDGQWCGKGDDDWDVSARSDEVPSRPAFQGISGALLRGIPIGRILELARVALSEGDWQEGLRFVGPRGVRVVLPRDLPSKTKQALEQTLGLEDRRRGRPPLDDTLLHRVAIAYLEEADLGRGLTRRLARRFDRPEETVRDWVHAARKRGFLSPGLQGRRGATPGPRLLAMEAADDEENDEGPAGSD